MTAPNSNWNTGSPKTRLAAMLIGLALGPVLYSLLATPLVGFKPEDTALGQDTNSFEAFHDGRRVSSRYPREIPELVDSWHELADAGTDVSLWMGASQLHAINQLGPDDQLAVYYANEQARARGADGAYLQFSLPNANLHDLLGVYLRFRQQGLLPQRLILALTYDDLREPGFNESSLRFLEPISEPAVELGGAGVANLREWQLAEEEITAPVERTATSGTPQERLENRLVETLENHWGAYRARGQILAFAKLQIFETLAAARGGAMQRRAPPVPDSQKQWNAQALDSLISLTRHDGVELTIYQAPHPAGETIFYHRRKAYDAFFEQLSARCASEGIHFVDLEPLVPTELWGLRGGNLDPFHFRDAGHRLLGAAIDEAIEAETASSGTTAGSGLTPEPTVEPDDGTVSANGASASASGGGGEGGDAVQ